MLYVIDPSEPTREIVRLSSEGDQPVISEYAALEYAPNLDQFVYYSATEGPRICSIAAPLEATWSELTAGVWIWQRLLRDSNGLDPIAHAASLSKYAVNKDHTFGRFRVATYGRTDVAILIRHTETPVYAMRLN